jgi:P27 family predicted phage terminase small subunit
MRGRKPKPTLLKDLHGSEEPRNPEEPIPVGTLVDDPADCPDYFNADLRASWEYAVRHSPPGMLKRIDAGTLEVWVVAEYMHRKATQALLLANDLLIKGEHGHPVSSPYNTIVRGNALIKMKAATELGFTPVSRPRIFSAGAPASGGDALTRPATDARDAPQQSIEEYLASAPRATSVH